MIWFLVIFMILAMSKYVSLILAYSRSWSDLPADETVQGFIPTTSVTIVVAARNEEDNIETCLDSILHQNYPKDLLKIVVVNDHSTDLTSKLVDAYVQKNNQVTLLNSKENEIGKKAAIQKAIASSHSTLIITTDADCTAGPNWIKALVRVYEKEKPVMILAPVVFNAEANWLNKVLRLEFLALMASTGATAQLGEPSMCNGANLCYERAAFYRVNGFSGIDGNPSGDDVFLMMKMHKLEQETIRFIKATDSIVTTDAPSTVKDFWQQRKRWLSKKSGYENGLVKRTAYTVYFGNAAMLVALILAQPFYHNLGFQLMALVVILAKLLVDNSLLKRASLDLNTSFTLVDFVLAEIFLAIYIPLIGLAGNSGNYVWKGRKANANGQ